MQEANLFSIPSFSPSSSPEGHIERTTSDIPTSQPIQLIYNCIGSGEKIETLPDRRGKVNRHTAVTVRTDGKNGRQVIYSSDEQSVTVEIEDIEKSVGKKKGVTKIFTHLLTLLCKQAVSDGVLVRNTLQVSINELVAKGFYSTPRSARAGLDSAMDILTGIKVKVDMKRGKNRAVSSKAIATLFPTYDRASQRGVAIIRLNEDIDWGTIAQYYTVIPNYYPKLSSNGLDLLFLIFTHSRLSQKRESLAQKGFFTISMRAIQDALALPDENNTKNPERDIKTPIENAIEDIENYERSVGYLKLTPSVDGTEPIKEYLEGYVKVVLEGEYRTKLDSITEAQKKKVQALVRRKQRIEDEALTRKLASDTQTE